MENKISTQLKKIEKSGLIGLMTHVIIGFPTLEDTKKLIVALEKGGSDFIELQIPFSDPIADGPTIMKASDIALKNGITIKNALQLMQEMSATSSVPLLFMCYYNSVYKYGTEEFCKQAAAAGASGLIIPDIPPEEERYDNIIELTKKYGLMLIRVVSPASSVERLKKNAVSAEGFVYCISRFGVTGDSANLDPYLAEYLKKVKDVFHLPKAVGFGISKSEHTKALANYAEIAVVGSAIVEKVFNIVNHDYSSITSFVKKLKSSK